MRIDDPNFWRESTIAQLRAINPGVVGPIYVVDLEEVKDCVRMSRTTWGLAAIDLCRVAEPTLRRLGLWQGQGICMVLRRASLCGDELTAFAAHELTHGLLHTTALARLAESIGHARVADILAKDIPAVLDDVSGPMEKPWCNHEPARFGRLAIHCHHRLRRLGSWAELRSLYDAKRYGLPATGEFAEKLGDEPERLSGLSLAEVNAMPAPDDYRNFCSAAMSRAEAVFQRFLRRKETTANGTKRN
jgi:hypothetical protein